MTDSRSATTWASNCTVTGSTNVVKNTRSIFLRVFCVYGGLMEYKTIARRCEARFIEKKSEFIGYLCPVQTEEQAVAFIEEIRAMHRKATHNCYAYILRENNAARHSDDGEPGGTAGVPIYEVLRKEGLTDVCCVVTRYFGGVLLGAGGSYAPTPRVPRTPLTRRR